VRLSRTVGWGCAVAVVAAAGAADPEAGAGHEEYVTVLERPLSAGTAAVTVLDRESIEALDAVSVTELMRHVPGLDVSTAGGRGGFATVQVRGGDPNFTAVLVNGVPLNDANDQFGGAVNLNSISVAHIERIEVIRGPVSSFLGSTGLAGAVNIVTRSGSNGSAWEAGVAAGDASALLLDASISGGGKTPFFVGATWEEEDGRVAEDGFSQAAVNGRARVAFGRAALAVHGRVAIWDNEDYPEGSGGPALGTGELRSGDNEEFGVGVRLDADRNQGYFDVYRHELERNTPAIPPDPSDPFNGVPASTESAIYTHAVAGWAFTFLRDGKRQLRVGAELDWEDGDNDATQDLPVPFPTDASFALDRWTTGAFIEWTRKRGPLLLELSARVDKPEDLDAEWGPRAGLTYSPGAGDTDLRVSAGRTFKVPSFYALGNPVVGNPGLAPEVGVGADAGVVHRIPDRGLRAELNVYWYRYDDLIDFDFATFSLINRSEVESRGAEAGLTLDVGPDVDLAFAVAYQDVEDRSTGEALLHRPEWIGSAAATWRPCERWSFTVDLQAVSAALDRQIPAPTRDSVAGHGVVGTAVAYRIDERWRLHARVDNLLDQGYETFIGFPGPARGFRIGLRFLGG